MRGSTIGMVGQISSEGFNSFGESVSFRNVVDCDFLGEGGIEFGGVDKGDVALADFLRGHFIEFEDVDALTVLVDQLHDVLQEVVQTLALEIQTDQVSSVVTLSFQKLLCLKSHVPMLLFCINLFL
jgi:hypothetical protein